MSARYRSPEPLPTYDPLSTQFIENRRGLATAALRSINRLKDNGALHVVNSTEEKGYRVFVEGSLTYKPETLFGVSTKYLAWNEIPHGSQNV
jgi:hypothetical protein